MKARILFSSLLLFVFSLSLGPSAFAADTRLIPFAVGYSFVFHASNGTNSWEEKMTSSGMTSIPSALQYYTVDASTQLGTGTRSLRSTPTTVYQYAGFGKETVFWKTGAAGTTWKYTEGDGKIIEKKIVALNQTVTVPYGTFTGCIKYQNRCTNCFGNTQWTEWIKPGFMMVKWQDYWSGGDTPTVHELISVTTP
ncbi:MAG: hypothetical protein WC291_01685 [Thermodesulfovibrionales bacterium]|jgi:hypothetical protein